MLVRFTKGSVAAKNDALVCERPDGTSSTAAMPKQGILPHDAFHFVVETTLGWTDAFFGQVAAGASLADTTARFHPVKKSPARLPRLRQNRSAHRVPASRAMGRSQRSHRVHRQARRRLPPHAHYAADARPR